MRVTVDHHEMPARDFNNNRRISTTTAQCQRTALRCLALGLAGAAVGDNAQSIAGYNPSGGVCRCRIKKLVVQVVKRCDACPISTGKPRKGVRSPNRVQSADVDGLASEEHVVGVSQVRVHFPNLQPVGVVEIGHLSKLVFIADRIPALDNLEGHALHRSIGTACAPASARLVRRCEAYLALHAARVGGRYPLQCPPNRAVGRNTRAIRVGARVRRQG
mmetsp:Transcript_30954/g.83072  ORF Transcript_30954/g.83072 Transcript_30954/m.83072 type:complete len:218 (-) Transcript_30954:1553-2206(-)